jgi:hypothetical protein
MIPKRVKLLQEFAFTCRKAHPADPFLRELLISFGRSGDVVLFNIENESTVTIAALRHQREENNH